MMHITITRVRNPRSSFNGCYRANLHAADGRILWSTNPGSADWARGVATQRWPTLEVRGA